MARDAQIQMRRDTAANWTSVNPTLAAGEWGMETDTFNVKIGDGSTAWATLPYERTPFLGVPGSTGNWWFIHSGSSLGSTTLSTLNLMYLYPIFLPRPVAIQQLAVNVVTGVAGSSLRVGLYSHDVTTGAPKLSTSPLMEFTSGGAISTTTSTTVGTTGTLSLTMPGGWSWLAYVGQGVSSAAIRTESAMPFAINNQYSTLSTTAPTATEFGSTRGGYTVSSVSGALSSITSLTTASVNPLHCAFKTA
jgi:hypothetical protein